MTKSVQVAHCRDGAGYRVRLLGEHAAQAADDLRACGREAVLLGLYGDVFGPHERDIHSAVAEAASELRALGYDVTTASQVQP